jgi:glycosyltransferase involved in cell wall biosynthesis
MHLVYKCYLEKWNKQIGLIDYEALPDFYVLFNLRGSIRDMCKKLTFIYPFDPMGPKVGGVETFIRGFIKYAPEDLKIQHIGVTSSLSERPLNVWQPLRIGNKEFDFHPILFERNENSKTIIPLSLRFTIRLSKLRTDISKSVLIFNRPEPCLAFIFSKHRKIGLVHNDVQKQLMKGSDSFWRHLPWIYSFAERRILASLDYIYTVNMRTLALYKQKYPAISNKVSFLPTWVDQDIFYATEEPRYRIRQELAKGTEIPSTRTWVLFVGRLQEQKAPIRLIETFHEYRKIDRKSHLLVIGEGNLKKEMSRKAKDLNICRYIHFFGYRSQRELARFYQAADVLLLTSNYEGMPRSCVEALGCGLPVVSTDVGEVCRVIHNGFSGEIVEDFSPVSIAGHIDKVVRNSAQYSKENCLTAVTDYTPEVVLSQIYERINSL